MSSLPNFNTQLFNKYLFKKLLNRIWRRKWHHKWRSKWHHKWRSKWHRIYDMVNDIAYYPKLQWPIRCCIRCSLRCHIRRHLRHGIWCRILQYWLMRMSKDTNFFSHFSIFFSEHNLICMEIKEVNNSVVDGLFKIDRFYYRKQVLIDLSNNIKIVLWNVHSLRLSTEFWDSANLYRLKYYDVYYV